ncbi:MAG: response regulator [Deltaproteobacteria bacterium]
MYIDEIIKQLHAGFIVKTSLCNTESYHYNIIQSIYGNTLALSNSYDSTNLIGQHLIIKTNTPSAEYILEAVILDVSNSVPQTIKVEILSCTKQNENRRFERYLIKLGANIKPSNDKIGAFSIINNISFTGVYLVTPLDISIKSPIKLDFLTGGNEDICTINGLVTRKIFLNDSFGYGIIFYDNNANTIDKLNAILHNANNFKFELYEKWQKGTTLQSQQNNSGITALIADDIKLTRSSLKNIFESVGIINIVEASNGSEVIERIESFQPDILTLDLSLPVINGVETIKHISGSFPLDRVIIISALIDNESMRILRELGVTKFVTKPFSEKQIIEEINKIIPGVLQC